MKQKTVGANDYIVIDDVIPVDEQERLERLIKFPSPKANVRIDWNYLHIATGGVIKKTISTPGIPDFYPVPIVESSQFVHSLQYTPIQKEVPVSATAPVTSPIFNYFTSMFAALPIGYKKIHRAKINMKFPVKGLTDYHYGTPHCDGDNPMDDEKVCIYYINDSDGDTIIFNETYDQWKPNPAGLKLTVKAKITPKRGRLVMFNANLVHSAGIPIETDMRLIVNINLMGCFPRKQ